MSTSSLYEHAKNSIFSVFKKIDDKVKNNYKYLIVDPAAFQIIKNLQIETTLLQNYNLSGIEKVVYKDNNNFKQNKIVICLLEPTDSNIDFIINELNTKTESDKDQKSSSLRVYAVFLYKIEDELMLNLTSSEESKRYLKGVYDLTVNYHIISDNVFSLENNSDVFSSWFNKDIDYDIKEYEPKITDRINNVLLTLNLNLTNVLTLDKEVMDHSKIQKLADHVKRKADKNISLDKNNATLILLDRSLDFEYPLLYDLGYEALAHELITELEKDEDNEYCYELEYEAQNKEKIKTKIKISNANKEDEIWHSLKAEPITKFNEQLAKRFKTFCNSNKAATLNKNKGQKLDANTMRQVVADIPKYQTLQTMYSLHFDMAEKIVYRFNKKCIKQIIEFEQNLMTEKPQALLNVQNEKIAELSLLLNDKQIQSSDKVKLIIIALFSGVIQLSDQNDLNDLLKMANLNSLHSDTVSYCDYLRSNYYLPSNSQSAVHRIDASIRNTTNTNYLQTFKSLLSMGKQTEEANNDELIAYISRISKIIDFYFNAPNATLFHCTSPAADDDNLVPKNAAPIVSLRSNKPTWQNKDFQSATTTPGSAPLTANKQHVYIFFVVGGLSYAEINTINTNHQSKNIYLGTTQVLDIKKYIKDISTLGKNGLLKLNSFPKPPVSVSNSIANKSNSPLSYEKVGQMFNSWFSKK